MPSEDPMQALLLQRCVMASFEDREHLQKPDLDIVKQAGLKVRGRGAWPLFRSYLPGYAPWFLTAAQARFLATALDQALVLAHRFQADRSVLSTAVPDGEFLVRVRRSEAGQEEWTDTCQRPEPPAVAAPEDPVKLAGPDPARIALLKSTLPRTNGVVEMDFVLLPNGVRGEDGGRPYFPVLILVADHETGVVLGTNLSRPDAVAQDFGDLFLAIVEAMQKLPARVQVGREEAQAFLEPWAKPLSVRVTSVRQLKALGPALDEMLMFLGMGPSASELLSLIAEEEDTLPAPRRPRRAVAARNRPAEGAGAATYQLKVTLLGMRPAIWRRILVPGDVPLDTLHRILQVAMGWNDSHLHAFTIGDDQYGPPIADLEVHDEGKYRLDQLVPTVRSRFRYEYDFGDTWEHEIRVEKILPPSDGRAACLDGKRACPPEDCGGIWGYINLIEILQEPDHPDYKEMRQWAGRRFDPEAFSPDEVNRRLKKVG